ncbi:MAG: metallophosphoesterase [Lautropia sp.]|nr:metallophosphoesterase [Lautropia sp.]
MRVALLSDLHLEFEPFTPPEELRLADLVILAGDIHNGVEALHWARRSFPAQPIVQIAGNHEFFGACWQTLLAELRQVARSLDIAFLENDSVVIGGVQFLGATLWTDFELLSAAGRPVRLNADDAKALMQRRMIDYSLIRWQPGGRPEERVFRPDDSVGLHLRSRDWLTRELAQPYDGPRVVITHHLPSWRSVAPAFARAPSNAAFASDLDELFGPVELWVHGHTHNSFNYLAGTTRVLANPRGYPMEEGGFENPLFKPALLVEVGF